MMQKVFPLYIRGWMIMLHLYNNQTNYSYAYISCKIVLWLVFKKTDHDVNQNFKKIGNVARYEETRTCTECHRGRRERYAHRGDMPKH